MDKRDCWSKDIRPVSKIYLLRKVFKSLRLHKKKFYNIVLHLKTPLFWTFVYDIASII